MIPLEEFNEAFSADWNDADVDTLGGYVAMQLGHLPRVGERLSLDGLEMQVVRADRRRVYTFKIARQVATAVEA